jgi:diphosphomevalonate decarboxylase
VAEAYAHTNIALIKYWGKRNSALNLPAVGSVSLTLDRFGTWTRALVDPSLRGDRFVLNGVEQWGPPLERVSRFLDLVGGSAGNRPIVHVESRNDVPTAAGLASSASAFAALAVAACGALNREASPATLSSLARQGSGSAARSIFGGFVRLHKGQRDDGQDCLAEPIECGPWDIRMVVASCAQGQKEVPSTQGMNETQRTSPYFSAWVQTHEADIQDAVQAIVARDLEKLGDVMEHSTLKMHASGMAARPGVLYWHGVTVECVRAMTALRRAGTGAWFTMDAGPHVKVLCQAQDASRVEETLGAVPGVLGVTVTAPGPAARRLS